MVLIEYDAPGGAWWRPMIGVTSIAYGIVVPDLVPYKERLFPGLFFAADLKVRATTMVPILAGITVLFNYWVSKREPITPASLGNYTKIPRWIFKTLGTILIVGLTSAGTLGAVFVRQRAVLGEDTNLSFQALPMDNLAWKLVVTIPVLLGMCFLKFSGLWSTSSPRELLKIRKIYWLIFVSSTAGLCSFLLTSFLLARFVIIQNSLQLTYQWTKQSWNPVGGWTIFYVGLTLGILNFVYELRRTARAGVHGPIAPRGMRMLLLLAVSTAFVRANLISNQTSYTRAIVCLDRKTGGVLWTCEGLVGPEGPFHGINSPATPTPVVHDGRVIAFFGYGGVMCSDLSGQLLWTNLDIRFESIFGVGTSPIAYKDKLIIACGTPDDSNNKDDVPTIYALDCATGKLRWRESMPRAINSVHCGLSRTPVIKEIHGKPVLLVWDYAGLSAHDPNSGKRFWSYPIIRAIGDDLVASVVTDEERIYCSGAVETVAVDLSKVGKFEDAAAWRVSAKGANCSSPILSNGKLFVITDGGIATCMDAKEGKILWKSRLKGMYYASPVASGNYVYFTNDAGRTTVIDATAPKFSRVGGGDMQSPTYASFAPLSDCIIGRTGSFLYCIDGRLQLAGR